MPIKGDLTFAGPGRAWIRVGNWEGDGPVVPLTGPMLEVRDLAAPEPPGPRQVFEGDRWPAEVRKGHARQEEHGDDSDNEALAPAALPGRQSRPDNGARRHNDGPRPFVTDALAS